MPRRYTRAYLLEKRFNNRLKIDNNNTNNNINNNVNNNIIFVQVRRLFIPLRLKFEFIFIRLRRANALFVIIENRLTIKSLNFGIKN